MSDPIYKYPNPLRADSAALAAKIVAAMNTVLPPDCKSTALAFHQALADVLLTNQDPRGYQALNEQAAGAWSTSSAAWVDATAWSNFVWTPTFLKTYLISVDVDFHMTVAGAFLLQMVVSPSGHPDQIYPASSNWVFQDTRTGIHQTKSRRWAVPVQYLVPHTIKLQVKSYTGGTIATNGDDARTIAVIA